MSLGSLSIERMCQMVPVTRRGFYRSLKERQPVEEEMEVRSPIQQIALEHRRRYGYRRIMAELHRRGMPVNHKRVARIMREDNLLGMQPERFQSNFGPVQGEISDALPRKRHQRRHLEFCNAYLLSRMAQVRVLPGAISLNCKE